MNPEAEEPLLSLSHPRAMAFEDSNGKESFRNFTLTYGTHLNFGEPEKSQGLPSLQVSESKARKSRNVIKSEGPIGPLSRSFWSVFNGFNGLLLLQGVLTLIHYGLKDKDDMDPVNLCYALFFFLSIVVNWLMMLYEEVSFGRQRNYNNLLPSRCKVKRDGDTFEISVADLVPGDLVLIETGCIIPADLRIFSCNEIKIQQSDINGEEDCIEGSARRVENDDLDLSHIIYAGSKCIEGSGMGLVIATGCDMRLGKIAKSARRKISQLPAQMNKLVVIIIALDIVVMLITVLVNLGDWDLELDDFLSISFGNVPQALFLTTTLCQIITAARLQASGVTVKRLEALETLSSVTVVLCDKSGTLTLNKGSIENFWFNQKIRTARQVQQTYTKSQESERKEHPLKGDRAWRVLFKTAMLCNRAQRRLGSEAFEGSATDQALLKFCLEVDELEVARCRQKFATRIHDVPFKSASKFEATVRQCGPNKACLFMKGAPEIVLEHCSHFLCDGRVLRLDARCLFH